MSELQERLLRVAQRTGLDVDDLLALLEGASSTSPAGFTASEQQALAAAGVSLAGPSDDPGGLGALVAGRSLEHEVLDHGLTVEEAAALLRVTPARVRQRIADGSVVAVRRSDGHVLPRWQFVDGILVPWLSALAEWARQLHPLDLANFMTRPSVDLVVDGHPVSPVAWLLTGGEAEPVAVLLRSVIAS